MAFGALEHKTMTQEFILLEKDEKDWAVPNFGKDPYRINQDGVDPNKDYSTYFTEVVCMLLVIWIILQE